MTAKEAILAALGEEEATQKAPIAQDAKTPEQGDLFSEAQKDTEEEDAELDLNFGVDKDGNVMDFKFTEYENPPEPMDEEDEGEDSIEGEESDDESDEGGYAPIDDEILDRLSQMISEARNHPLAGQEEVEVDSEGMTSEDAVANIEAVNKVIKERKDLSRESLGWGLGYLRKMYDDILAKLDNWEIDWEAQAAADREMDAEEEAKEREYLMGRQ